MVTNDHHHYILVTGQLNWQLAGNSNPFSSLCSPSNLSWKSSSQEHQNHHNHHHDQNCLSSVPWVVWELRQRRLSSLDRAARWRPTQSQRRSASKVLFAPGTTYNLTICLRLIFLIFWFFVDISLAHRFVLDGGRAHAEIEFVLVLSFFPFLLCLCLFHYHYQQLLSMFSWLPVCTALSKPGPSFHPETFSTWGNFLTRWMKLMRQSSIKTARLQFWRFTAL